MLSPKRFYIFILFFVSLRKILRLLYTIIFIIDMESLVVVVEISFYFINFLFFRIWRQIYLMSTGTDKEFL